MNIFRDAEEVDASRYIIATYDLWAREGSTVRDAAWNLAIGQSVGNPTVRNEYETDELFEKHSCLVLGYEPRLAARGQDFVRIAFPLANIDLATDGVTQLLVQLMGGQMDIGIIKRCRLIDIHFPLKYSIAD